MKIKHGISQNFVIDNNRLINEFCDLSSNSTSFHKFLILNTY